MTTADRPHGPLPVLLVCLTVVTGLVDAFSYLRLGHVFVANMTGNVVSSASRWPVWARFQFWLAFSRCWPSPLARRWAGGGQQDERCTVGTF